MYMHIPCLLSLRNHPDAIRCIFTLWNEMSDTELIKKIDFLNPSSHRSGRSKILLVRFSHSFHYDFILQNFQICHRLTVHRHHCFLPGYSHYLSTQFNRYFRLDLPESVNRHIDAVSCIPRQAESHISSCPYRYFIIVSCLIDTVQRVRFLLIPSRNIQQYVGLIRYIIRPVGRISI